MRQFDYVLDMMAMALRDLSTLRIKGRVFQVVGTIVKAVVPHVKVGEVCVLRNPGDGFEIKAEVVGLAKDSALLTPLGEMTGKKVTSERRFMPGYVLVRMEMTNRGYHLISSINRVTGFLGPQGKPMPMRDAEVNGILNRVEEGEAQPRNLIRFDIGEKVKVTDGPFEGFDGMVEEVDDEHSRLKVSVSIFGRATPVELEFTQVSKGI